MKFIKRVKTVLNNWSNLIQQNNKLYTKYSEFKQCIQTEKTIRKIRCGSTKYLFMGYII